MGAEAAFAGDGQIGIGIAQGQFGLGEADRPGAATPRHRPAEAAELIGVGLRPMDQLGAEAMAGAIVKANQNQSPVIIARSRRDRMESRNQAGLWG